MASGQAELVILSTGRAPRARPCLSFAEHPHAMVSSRVFYGFGLLCSWLFWCLQPLLPPRLFLWGPGKDPGVTCCHFTRELNVTCCQLTGEVCVTCVISGGSPVTPVLISRPWLLAVW